MSEQSKIDVCKETIKRINNIIEDKQTHLDYYKRLNKEYERQLEKFENE